MVNLTATGFAVSCGRLECPVFRDVFGGLVGGQLVFGIQHSRITDAAFGTDDKLKRKRLRGRFGWSLSDFFAQQPMPSKPPG
jgi:hypothetical protein